MAEADLAKDDKQAAAAILTEYEKAGGRDPDDSEATGIARGRRWATPKEAAATLDRINYIYPVKTKSCTASSAICGSRRRIITGAIREYNAVVAMNPLDKASAAIRSGPGLFCRGTEGQGRG